MLRIVVLVVGLFSIALTSEAATKPSLVEGSRLKETSVVYNNRRTRVYCLSSTPGSARLKGSQFLFTSFAYTLSKVSKSREPSKYNKYRSLAKLGKSECKRLVVTPTPTPTGNFDLSGNVTELGRTIFGIPAGLAANISTGRAVQNAKCTGCHGERVNYTFPEVREAIKRSPMLYDEAQIPDSELANLIAYLNRFRP